MYAEERRRAIADRASADGRVEVAALAAEFDVTPETIRRDLSDLERRNVVRRVHGGAIAAEPFTGELRLTEKATVRAAEKRRIAQAALARVPDGGIILIDAGTTTGELANLLPDTALTVITNALPIATTLAERTQLTVLCVGGRVRGRTMATVDAWATRMLGDLRVDTAFVATNGVSVERGLSTHDPAEAAVKAAMIACARHVVLLADHTKFGAEHFVRYASLGQIDTVITDGGLADAHIEALEDAGPRVVIA